MTKNIGLSQKIKLEWLNEITSMLISKADEKQIKAHLEEYLNYEIKSETNIRKTKTILMNIWLSSNTSSAYPQKQALELISRYPKYSLVIHWCMIMTAYPVFADICRVIGQISRFQEVITNNQIKQKMFDEWGERSTLYYSIDKSIMTLKNLGVLVPIKQGSYSIRKFEIDNDEIVIFMFKTFLLNDNKSSRTFAELQNLACFFPFNYNLNQNLILTSSEFKIVNLGGSFNISLKNS